MLKQSYARIAQLETCKAASLKIAKDLLPRATVNVEMMKKTIEWLEANKEYIDDTANTTIWSVFYTSEPTNISVMRLLATAYNQIK